MRSRIFTPFWLKFHLNEVLSIRAQESGHVVGDDEECEPQ